MYAYMYMSRLIERGVSTIYYQTLNSLQVQECSNPNLRDKMHKNKQ